MMPINRTKKTILKWLLLQFVAIIAFAGLIYCDAHTATLLYFFGTAAKANVHSAILIDVGRSSGARDTIATYVFTDSYHNEHYNIESFPPVKKIDVGSTIDILYLKQLPKFSMADFDVKIMAKESVPAILLVFLAYFEATRRLIFLKTS